MENPKFNFEDLQVYQKSLDFVDFVYETVKTYPVDERYRLTSQYVRAASSIPLNIAEGHGDTDAQFNRFLQIAWGSTKECVVCSTIARRQNYISEEQNIEARIKLSELAKMTTSLQRYIKNKKK
jgi:four helix bundle protein